METEPKIPTPNPQPQPLTSNLQPPNPRHQTPIFKPHPWNPKSQISNQEKVTLCRPNPQPQTLNPNPGAKEKDERTLSSEAPPPLSSEAVKRIPW
jgi:hypothetical protein